MRFLFRPAAVLASVALLAAAFLASCGSAAPGVNTSSAPASSAPTSTAPQQISVVASTNVWGDIAAQVGGDSVAVTSLIHDPSQDPHSFQPSGRDELAVSRADVVIVNGGGYDDFLVQMLASAGDGATVITATEAAAHVPTIDPDNEHVWLNLDAVQAVAGELARAYSQLVPARADDFRTHLDTFDRSLDPIRAGISAVAAAHAGDPVAVTEPLPGYLLSAADLRDVTPSSFTEAVEEGVDVSPSDLISVLALFDEHRVKLLVFNEQAASSQAEQVLAAAKENGVAVMPVTELLPSGQHYQQWLAGMVDTLGELLGGQAAT